MIRFALKGRHASDTGSDHVCTVGGQLVQRYLNICHSQNQAGVFVPQKDRHHQTVIDWLGRVTNIWTSSPVGRLDVP